jgi:hypothetical protein
MPVTAKLSLRFYEKLGEDVANELVEWCNSSGAAYRSDPRELNELNSARFDAKLEQRLAGSDARWEQRGGPRPGGSNGSQTSARTATASSAMRSPSRSSGWSSSGRPQASALMGLDFK